MQGLVNHMEKSGVRESLTVRFLTMERCNQKEHSGCNSDNCVTLQHAPHPS